MFPACIEDALTKVEGHFNDVSIAQVSGKPLVLVDASASLRKATIDFFTLLQHIPSTDLKSNSLKLRLNRLADGMAVQRENLIRQAALVEMALNTIVPATRSATYTQDAAPYGSLGKQTGTFKYLIC